MFVVLFENLEFKKNTTALKYAEVLENHNYKTTVRFCSVKKKWLVIADALQVRYKKAQNAQSVINSLKHFGVSSFYKWVDKDSPLTRKIWLKEVLASVKI